MLHFKRFYKIRQKSTGLYFADWSGHDFQFNPVFKEESGYMDIHSMKATLKSLASRKELTEDLELMSYELKLVPNNISIGSIIRQHEEKSILKKLRGS